MNKEELAEAYKECIIIGAIDPDEIKEDESDLKKIDEQEKTEDSKGDEIK